MIIIDMGNNGMSNMMDILSSNWILIILGIIGFFIVLFILLILLNKGKQSNPQLNNEKLNPPQSIIQNDAEKEPLKYCPGCGTELDIQKREYCSVCGFKL